MKYKYKIVKTADYEAFKKTVTDSVEAEERMKSELDWWKRNFEIHKEYSENKIRSLQATVKLHSTVQLVANIISSLAIFSTLIYLILEITL